jgi:bacterioferritin-associated ferredoxin
VNPSDRLDGREFESYFQYHSMIVCLCHAVTERDLERVISEGANTVEEIGRRCGAGTDCGTCVRELKERLGGDADPAMTAGCASASAGCGSALVSVRSRRAD